MKGKSIWVETRIEKIINQYLRSISRHLGDRKQAEKQELLRNIRDHICEKLAAQAGDNPTAADVKEVLAEMDEPKSYDTESDIPSTPGATSGVAVQKRKRILGIIGVCSLGFGILLPIALILICNFDPVGSLLFAGIPCAILSLVLGLVSRSEPFGKAALISGSAFLLFIVVIFLFDRIILPARSTAPDPRNFTGDFHVPDDYGGSFMAYQFEQGLSVAIITDSNLMWSTATVGSREVSWRADGGIRWLDGQKTTYVLETEDGKNAYFFLDGNQYDLGSGTLFLVRKNGWFFRITQLRSPLDRLCPDQESCAELLKQDPAIRQFILETLQSQ